MTSKSLPDDVQSNTDTLLVWHRVGTSDCSTLARAFKGQRYDSYSCRACDKTYTGKNARSIARRHLQDKHDIPLSMQARRNRWDREPCRGISSRQKCSGPTLGGESSSGQVAKTICDAVVERAASSTNAAWTRGIESLGRELYAPQAPTHGDTSTTEPVVDPSLPSIPPSAVYPLDTAHNSAVFGIAGAAVSKGITSGSGTEDEVEEVAAKTLLNLHSIPTPALASTGNLGSPLAATVATIRKHTEPPAGGTPQAPAYHPAYASPSPLHNPLTTDSVLTWDDLGPPVFRQPSHPNPAVPSRDSDHPQGRSRFTTPQRRQGRLSQTPTAWALSSPHHPNAAAALGLAPSPIPSTPGVWALIGESPGDHCRSDWEAM